MPEAALAIGVEFVFVIATALAIGFDLAIAFVSGIVDTLAATVANRTDAVEIYVDSFLPFWIPV